MLMICFLHFKKARDWGDYLPFGLSRFEDYRPSFPQLLRWGLPRGQGLTLRDCFITVPSYIGTCHQNLVIWKVRHLFSFHGRNCLLFIFSMPFHKVTYFVDHYMILELSPVLIGPWMEMFVFYLLNAVSRYWIGSSMDEIVRFLSSRCHFTK